MCKVSVIIPIYNGEQFLSECLDSVINQTLSDIEIICVNDGSKDNSLNILNEYASKDKRIKIIDQKNGGISNARNNGVTIAKGEFLSFVDCDDKLSLNFYEGLYKAASKYGADIAASGVFRLKEGRKRFFVKVDKEALYVKTEDKFRVMNIPKSCYVWNKIYNRQSYLDAGLTFREGMFYEDIEFTHNALHKLKKLVTVPNVIYYYRITPFSTVGQSDKKKLEDMRKATEFGVNFVRVNKIKVSLCKYKPISKKHVKVLGIPIMKIKDWGYCKKYLLFGCIPLITHDVDYR